jgi:hypothetical protein
VEGIGLREGPDGELNLYVGMIVDPDRSGRNFTNPNLHLSLYHYSRGARQSYDSVNR